MLIIYVLLTIVFIFILMIMVVDIYFYMVNRYCRFHIGRWNYDEWVKAIKKVVEKWVIKTPTVKITDNSRYMLLDMINGKYRSNSIQSWQKASLILALEECGDIESQKMVSKAIDDLISKDGSWLKKPTNVDCGMLAYSILRNCNADDVRPAMDEVISLIEKSIDEDGYIIYTGNKNDTNRYVDTLGLVCPFLMLYGLTYNYPKYIDLAMKQIVFYHDFGLYKDTSLPNHAIGVDTKLPLGVYGWGRGIGWYVIALVDCYLTLNECDEKSILRKYIFEAAESYLKYQRDDGGFGSIVQMKDTYDSSATAVLAYFYMHCFYIFSNEKYKNIADKCLMKLKSVTRINGKVDWCQGDTKGIGIFSQTYDIMPFTQGLTLRTIKLGEMKNGR